MLSWIRCYQITLSGTTPRSGQGVCHTLSYHGIVVSLICTAVSSYSYWIKDKFPHLVWKSDSEQMTSFMQS